MPISASKRLLNLMDHRRNFMGQRAPSQLGMVTGSKTAGVQISDFYRFWWEHTTPNHLLELIR